MKYAAEMGSVAMIYIPSFIKIDSGIQKLIGGICRHADTQKGWSTHKPTLGKWAKSQKRNKIKTN
jgi:hypothetical protein